MTDAPELPAELWAKLWGEALQRHPDASVLPGPTSIEVACLAYAAGWEARAAVKDSLTAAEDPSVVGASPADPIRTALERLLKRLDETGALGDPAIPAWIDSYAAARAVLAAAPSDGEAGPSEEEWNALVERVWDAHQTIGHQGERFMWDRDFDNAAVMLRDALARWGRPVSPPAEGEVGELVALVGIAAGACAHEGYHDEAQACRRAAALLEQQAAELERLRVVPVAVSERTWEWDGWCNEQGQCWMGDPGGGGFIPSWRFCRPEDAPKMRVSLPYSALPLPSGEATNG